MTAFTNADSGKSARSDDRVEYLLRLADDRLVLGHRLSEWCGHAPILEEDIALANIALDLIGQANLLLGLAAKIESRGRDADGLAYLRDAIDFRNALLVELPKGDFGVTIVRQLFYAVFAMLQAEALQRSTDQDVAGVAAKAVKEFRYHVRHSADWVLKLGAGTTESHARAQNAVNELWPYTGELFLADDVDRAAAESRFGVDPSEFESSWQSTVRDVLARAGLAIPETAYMQRGGRQGRHTEHLGHMLAEMQIVARSHPGASW